MGVNGAKRADHRRSGLGLARPLRKAPVGATTKCCTPARGCDKSGQWNVLLFWMTMLNWTGLRQGDGFASSPRMTGVVGVFGDFNNQSWPMPTRVWHFYLRHSPRNEGGAEWQGRVVGPLLRFGYHPVPGDVMPMEWMGTL